MAAKTDTGEMTQIAVRCDRCQRIVAYKVSTCSGYIQIKCPKCGKETVIDLSLRKGKPGLFFRMASILS